MKIDREIKFRAWDKKLKSMIYDVAVGFGFCGIQAENNCSYFESKHDNDLLPLQFAGLKDKSGFEIYEGDIYHKGEKGINYVVVWHDTGLIGKQINSRSNYSGLEHWKNKIEVIGNIYENPDLLI